MFTQSLFHCRNGIAKVNIFFEEWHYKSNGESPAFTVCITFITMLCQLSEHCFPQHQQSFGLRTFYNMFYNTIVSRAKDMAWALQCLKKKAEIHDLPFLSGNQKCRCGVWFFTSAAIPGPSGLRIPSGTDQRVGIPTSVDYLRISVSPPV